MAKRERKQFNYTKWLKAHAAWVAEERAAGREPADRIRPLPITPERQVLIDKHKAWLEEGHHTSAQEALHNELKKVSS